MVKKWALIGAILLCPLSLFGQTLAGVNGDCQVGGQQTLTSGLPSTGTQQIGTTNVLQGAGVQASFPSCLVTVYLTGTITKASIFSNNNPTPTPVSNPFTANGDSSYTFFVANACYDVVLSSGSVTMPYSRTIADICPGGNSGGGGTVGPGTQTHIPVFSSPTTIGDSEGISTGTGPVQWPLGVSLGTNALFYNKCRNGSTGTTANLLVAYDASGCAINAQPTDTQNLKGIARSTGAGGTVDIAYSGQYNLTFDNQTAIGDWAILGSGSQGHDAGAVQPSGIDTIGKIDSVNAGAGTLAVVEMNLPDVTNTSSGGGTGIVSPCATPGSIYYAQTVSSTATCDPGLTTDGAGGLIGASFTSNGPGGGLLTLFGSSSGSCPLSVDATAATFATTCLLTLDQNGLSITNTAATPSTSELAIFVGGTGRGQITFFGSASSTMFFDVDGGMVYNPSATSANKITYNNAGVFYAGSSASFNAGTITCAFAPHGSCSAAFAQPLVLQGNTSGGTVLYAQDIAGSHAIGFPAADGTVALTSNTSAVNSTFVNNPITSTYVATKNGPWIDPKAWGCANDGATDDTTCFQNAVNYAVANHGAVICSGSYKLDRVQVSTNTWIQGTNNSNERGCQIVVKTDGAFVSANPTSYLGSVTIHDIKFLNGSNPIDLALINGADIRDVDFLNQTGCGVVIVDGERHTLWGLQATHTGANGFATLCTGDKSKSLFSGVLGAGPFGIARVNIKDLRELGNLNGGSNFSQYLWWGGQGVGGNISTTTVENTICFFSCTAGYIWMDAMTYSSMNDLDMDNISTVGSPASVGLYITNGMTGSWVSSFNPAFNTNHIVTQMKIANLGDSTISNSKFSGDNVSTFGLYIGGGASAGGQLIAIEGPVFVNGANSNNTKNEISVSGSQITTTNFGAGAILSDINNLGAEVTLLGNAINTTPATSTFRVHRFLSGGQPGTFSDDFVSGPTTFTLSRNLVMDNSSGTAQYENGIVSTWYSDAGSTTKAFINGSNGQLSLPTTGSASTPLIQLGTTAGTGFFQRTGGEIDVTSASTAQFDFSGNYFAGASGNLFCFLNGAVGGSSDTCWSRSAAGIMAVGTGAAGSTDGTVKVSRLMAGSLAPTCTFTSGGGTTPSCALDTGSSDSAGVIKASTGTGSPGGAGTITLTFSAGTAFGTNKPVCGYWASDAGTAAWQASPVFKDLTPTTASDIFTWTNGPTPTALSTSSTYWINYHCWAK